MNEVKHTSLENIRSLPNLAISDPQAGLDLFDIQIGRTVDTQDEDLNLLSILCHSYILNNKQLISMHYETSDNDLDNISAKLKDDTYYLRVIKYSKDGSIKDSQTIKATFNSVSIVVHSDNGVVSKAFIFNIEH